VSKIISLLSPDHVDTIVFLITQIYVAQIPEFLSSTLDQMGRVFPKFSAFLLYKLQILMYVIELH
jgi:hypothetical protein